MLSNVALAGFLVGGCSPKSPAAKEKESPSNPAIAALPVEFRVMQRSTISVPGSAEALKVTIGDITRNQTMVSMAGKQEDVILANRSMNPGATAGFKFGGESLFLTLTRLDNALLGEDFATFTISRESSGTSPAVVMNESRKIALLLQHIEGMKGATFVRNNEEFSPAQAARHLASKVQLARRNDMTAREFVDNIASKSSVSDEVYTIRMADGTEVAAGDHLRQELNRIEQAQTPDKK